ncbi:MAG: hypothetical protein ACO3DY_06920 [Candidatus Nanopelagicaceae bacterium]|jgi:hypothetical protein
MSFKAFAAAALLAGTASASLAAPDAHAQVFTPDAGGFYGLCDSSSSSLLFQSSRNCQAARDYAAQEGARNREHARTSQFIELGGNLITGLILNSQNQNREPERTSPSEAELAILRQQQEIELLKLKLQLQQQQAGAYGAGVNVQNVQPMPGYPQSPYGAAY